MLGAVARIFQRGRWKGFRAIAITQRPANVHKRVLAQCNTLITLRLVAPQDRKAVADWIRGHADDETGRQVVDSLPRLGRGEGWVWAPEQNVLKRATFPPITTSDSMRAPEDGETHEAASWAQADLEAIRTEMAEAVAEADANDPKRLKAEIAQLRKQLAGKGNSVPPALDVEAIRREAIQEVDGGDHPQGPPEVHTPAHPGDRLRERTPSDRRSVLNGAGPDPAGRSAGRATEGVLV